MAKKAHNASDQEAVEAQAKKVELERKQELADVKELISKPEGIRFFQRMMELGLMFHTTFTGNSQGFFREGHRNLALIFFRDIAEAAPNKIAELVVKKEEKKREVE